jgi:hypothetical protein
MNNNEEDNFFIDQNNGNKISRDYTKIMPYDGFMQEYKKIKTIIGDLIEKEIDLKKDLEYNGVYAALYFQLKLVHKEVLEMIRMQVKKYGEEEVLGVRERGNKEELELEERIHRYLDLYLMLGALNAEQMADPKQRIDYFHIKNKRMLK